MSASERKEETDFMTNIKLNIVYHRPCVDGFAAAWAARFGITRDYPTAAVSYIGAAPNQRLNLDRVAPVYFLDLCPQKKFLLELLDAGHEVVVIDHHKTAVEDVVGMVHPNLRLIMDQSHSGAVLSWNYFNPGVEPPIAFRWIEDRDLWKNAIPESEAAVETLLAYDYDFDTWDKLIVDEARLLAESTPLLALKRKRIGEIVSRAYFTNVGGYDVPVVNADFYLNEVLTVLSDKYPDSPFAAAWYRRGNGSKKWSLRSRGTFDVQELAKRYGGGGHPGSAGFVTP